MLDNDVARSVAGVVAFDEGGRVGTCRCLVVVLFGGAALSGVAAVVFSEVGACWDSLSCDGGSVWVGGSCWVATDTPAVGVVCVDVDARSLSAVSVCVVVVA